MAITLRSVKGTPLTNAEMDANFTTLDAGKADTTGELFTGDTGVQKTSAGIIRMIVDRVAGSIGTLVFRSGGSDRWHFRANATAEAGSNVGSDLELEAYDDSGVTLGKVLTVPRVSRVVDFKQAPTINGASFLDPSNSTLNGTNRIINGDCRVQQKAAVAAVPGTFQYGGVDRFANICGSTQTPGVTQQAQVDADENGTNKNWVRHQVTTALTDFSVAKYWGGITQCIEGANVFDLKGNPKGVTVSFRFKAKVAGTYGVTLFDNAVTNSVTKTITVLADTPQYFSVTFPTIPTGVSANSSNTTYLGVRIGGLNTGTYMCPTANLGTWQTTGYYSAQGQVNWGASTANYIQVTDLQFEEGQVATPFERRSYGQELDLCKRYYRKISFGAGFSVMGFAASAAVAYTMQTFETPMRVTPSCTLSAGITYAGAGTWNTGGVIAANSPTAWSLNLSGSGGTTGLAAYFSNTAAVDFMFNAEF